MTYHNVYTCSYMLVSSLIVNLLYENGELIRGLTRGDGSQGDNITNNIKTINSIPLKLKNKSFPNKFEIRGEIIMPKTSFSSLNKKREQLGLPLFMNPRNTASGSLKMLDSSDVARRPLDCYLYHVIGEKLPSNLHYDNLQHAKSWGFKISSNCCCISSFFIFNS